MNIFLGEQYVIVVISLLFPSLQRLLFLPSWKPLLLVLTIKVISPELQRIFGWTEFSSFSASLCLYQHPPVLQPLCFLCGPSYPAVFPFRLPHRNSATLNIWFRGSSLGETTNSPVYLGQLGDLYYLGFLSRKGNRPRNALQTAAGAKPSRFWLFTSDSKYFSTSHYWLSFTIGLHNVIIIVIE